MKLREMNTEEFCAALCALTGPMCRIAEDEKAQAAFDALMTAELTKLPVLKAWSMLVATLVPVLLQSHAEDTYAMTAILTGKTVQELRAQSGLQTLSELRACWDEDLAAFFSFAGCTAQATS